MAFVVDGWALEIALKHHRKDFVELAILSRTAICCRVTPSQKAQVSLLALGAFLLLFFPGIMFILLQSGLEVLTSHLMFWLNLFSCLYS